MITEKKKRMKQNPNYVTVTCSKAETLQQGLKAFLKLMSSLVFSDTTGNIKYTGSCCINSQGCTSESVIISKNFEIKMLEAVLFHFSFKFF